MQLTIQFDVEISGVEISGVWDEWWKLYNESFYEMFMKNTSTIILKNYWYEDEVIGPWYWRVI